MRGLTRPGPAAGVQGCRPVPVRPRRERRRDRLRLIPRVTASVARRVVPVPVLTRPRSRHVQRPNLPVPRIRRPVPAPPSHPGRPARLRPESEVAGRAPRPPCRRSGVQDAVVESFFRVPAAWRRGPGVASGCRRAVTTTRGPGSALLHHQRRGHYLRGPGASGVPRRLRSSHCRRSVGDGGVCAIGPEGVLRRAEPGTEGRGGRHRDRGGTGIGRDTALRWRGPGPRR